MTDYNQGLTKLWSINYQQLKLVLKVVEEWITAQVWSLEIRDNRGYQLLLDYCTDKTSLFDESGGRSTHIFFKRKKVIEMPNNLCPI